MRNTGSGESSERFGTRGVAGLTVLAFFLLVLAAALAFWADHEFKANTDLVRESMLTKESALTFLGEVKDAEIGQRGYILTRRKSYLDPYTSAVGSVQESLDALAALAIHDGAERRAVVALQSSLDAKLAELRQTVSLVEAGQIGSAVDLVQSDTGKREMDRMRASVAAILSSENTILDAGLQRLERWSALGRSAIASLILIVIVLGTLIGFSMRTRWREQSDINRRVARLNEELEERVERRTAEAAAASRAAEEERRRAEFERQRVETLLQDMNHRVGNNLSMVSALLGMQITASDNDEVRRALRAASTRIATIGAAQRRLRLTNDLGGTRLDHLLTEVIGDLAVVTTKESVTLRCHAQPCVVDSRDAITVSTILSELVVNSLKHAFPGERGGRIDVDFGCDAAGARLRITDDGAGFADEAPAASKGGGLGTSIVHRLARQFEGSVAIHSSHGHGSEIIVTLPRLVVRLAGPIPDASAVNADAEPEAGADSAVMKG